MLGRLRVLASQIRGLFTRRRLDEDFQQELEAHLGLLTEENMRRGMPREEARRAARVHLGGATQLLETHRELHGLPWVESSGQDIRYALRTLRKNPGFTAVAVLTLALGIGANTAIFTVINAVMLRPLPYSEPGRLVRVTGYYPKGVVVALQELSRTMEVAGFTMDRPEDSEFNLTGQGEAVHIKGSSVSANIFSLLGAGAMLGRTFQPGEDRAGQDRLVIFSHALWQNKFGCDSGIIGHVVKIDGVDRQVVGVMPPDFNFFSFDAQLWIPLHIDPTNAEDSWHRGYMPIVGRLRPSATIEQAQSEIRQLNERVIPMFPFPLPRNWNADAAVISLQQFIVGDALTKLLVLLGAVGIVLMIACTNVASLLLSLWVSRRKEIALRAALGAARGRIVRQLLTESLVLALAGGGVGLALGFGALTGLKSFLLADTPRLAEVGMDWRVLSLLTIITIFTGLAFGLVPALRASRFNLAEAVSAGGQRFTDKASLNLRSSFIVVEVALAVVLVIGAGLLIKSLWRLTLVNPGFRTEQLLSVRVTPDPSLCQERAACVALYGELLIRARGISGVSEIAAANTLPLSGSVPAVVVEMEGYPLKPGESLAPILWAGAITPEYFRIMGIPLLEGRGFSDSDGEKAAGVVIVSAAMARYYWPGQDPVGKHIRVVWDRDWRTVVGVAADVRQFDLADNSPDWLKGAVYMPYPQAVDLTRRLPMSMNLIARTSVEPGNFASEIRGLVSSVNPNVPVSEVRTMGAIVSASASASSSMMWLFVAFAAIALVLATVGIYGVMAFSVAQRTREIGIRMALGAEHHDVLRMVVGQGIRLTFAGLFLGLAGAWTLGRFLTAFLYGVRPTDPATFALVSVTLMTVSVLASYVPARRAAKVDPMVALRHE